MAEENDLSRTEPASPRRLQEARDAGDVPRSAEFAAWVVMATALGALAWSAPRVFGALQGLAATAYAQAHAPLFSPEVIEAAQSAAWALLPLFAAVVVAALVAPLLLSGWVYAPQRAQADLARANPFRAFARLLSADTWFDGALGLLRLVLAVAAAAWALADGWPQLQALAASSEGPQAGPVAAWLARGLLALVGALAIAAALDAGWRWWRYLRRHAMTWQEVLAEAREAEGSPEMRARLRERQQQAGKGPLANPAPRAGEGTNAGPNAVNEVIG